MYHHYTISTDEVSNLVENENWFLEGIACWIYATDQGSKIACYAGFPSLIKLHRLYHSDHGDHLFTTDSSEVNSAQEAGYVYEGFAGWVFSRDAGDEYQVVINPSDNTILRTVPLYRLYYPSSGEHFYTISGEERDAAIGLGYVYEKMACRVFSVPPTSFYPAASAMFRLASEEAHWYDFIVDGAKYLWNKIGKPILIGAILGWLGSGGSAKQNEETKTIDANLDATSEPIPITGTEVGLGVAAWSSNRLDVFYRGQNNAVWHRTWEGSQWRGEECVGGILTSAPAAAAGASNRLDVFYRGQDNAVWHRAWDGSQGRGEECIGGILS